jgi:hypothetical protein
MSWVDIPSLADLRAKHAAAIEAMKSMYSTDDDEVTLIRIAMAEQGDLQKCIKRWGDIVTYRQTSAITVEEKENDSSGDALLRWCPAEYNYCEAPVTVAKDAVVKLPVSFIHWGNMNPLQLMGNANSEALLEQQGRVLLKTLNELNAKSRESGYLVRGVYIVDLEGVGLDHISGDFIKFLTPLFTLAQKNFPELVAKVIFVKAPLSYPIGWSAMQPLLAQGTQDKCLKLGFEFQADLFQMIADSAIPEYLSGSSAKPCYRNFEEDFQVEFIDARKSFSVEVAFSPEAHEAVDFEFRTEKNDIGFSASFVPADESKEDTIEVFKSKRVEAYKVLTSGRFKPNCKGTLHCTFDNSYSFLTSKALIYRVRAIPKKK